MARPCRFRIAIVSLWVAAPVAASHATPRLHLDDAAMPSWSPDGAVISYIDTSSDSPQVWLAPRGGMPTVLTRDASTPLWPLWLRDGERIAYYRSRRDANGPHREIVFVDLRGQPQAAWPVPTIWDDVRLSQSPDGSVLYSTFAATFALDGTTGATRQVAPGVGAAISPDGQWIAYTDADDSLVVGPVAGPPSRALGHGGLADWLPDSRHLAFVRFVGGHTDLVLTNLDGSHQTLLTDDPYEEWDLRVSPDGREIAYTRSVGESPPMSIWIVTVPPLGVSPATWTSVKRAYR